MRRNAIVAGWLIASLVMAPGCVHKYVQKVAVCDPRDVAGRVEPAPRSGMYRVQLVDENGHYLKSPLYAADRWVAKGERMGFSHGEDGKLLAIAGEQHVELNGLPPGAAHVMWYHKSKMPTQFAKSVGKVGSTTAQAMLLTTTGVAIVAGTAGLLWVAGLPDPCDDNV